jgi:hypothetical protein
MKQNISELLCAYFYRKYPPLSHRAERQAAHQELLKLTGGKRAALNSEIDKIERSLAGSLPVEIDACEAKKQGSDYVMFFEFSLRLKEGLVWGVFELSDSGVFMTNINALDNNENKNFNWMDADYLGKLKFWLESK